MHALATSPPKSNPIVRAPLFAAAAAAAARTRERLGAGTPASSSVAFFSYVARAAPCVQPCAAPCSRECPAATAGVRWGFLYTFWGGFLYERILMYGACILQDTLQDTRTGIPRTYPSCILMYLKYVSYMLSYIRMVAVENFDFGNLRNEPNKP